jgi:hypothetical protein
MHTVVLLGDKAQVEARFSLFGDSANFDARQVNGLPQMYHRLKNLFGCTQWLLGDLGHVKSCFCPFEIVLVSVQDSSTVCAKHTIGLRIILGCT